MSKVKGQIVLSRGCVSSFPVRRIHCLSGSRLTRFEILRAICPDIARRHRPEPSPSNVANDATSHGGRGSPCTAVSGPLHPRDFGSRRFRPHWRLCALRGVMVRIPCDGVLLPGFRPGALAAGWNQVYPSGAGGQIGTIVAVVLGAGSAAGSGDNVPGRSLGWGRCLWENMRFEIFAITT